MDVSSAAAPKSDQQNYEDYLSGPKTVTVSEVRRGGDEQPVEVHLVEFPGRPFKPSKTALRTIMLGWGAESDVWAGRRMTLYGDPAVKWAGMAVGGVRVSHLSHIDKPFKVALTETRGKKQTHSILPLGDAPVSAPAVVVTLADVADCTTAEELRSLWHASADETVREAIVARRAELASAPTA